MKTPIKYNRSRIMRNAWYMFKKNLCKSFAAALRKAIGTLKDTATLVKGTGRPDDGRTVKYYDVEADGWRSFKVENFITAY